VDGRLAGHEIQASPREHIVDPVIMVALVIALIALSFERRGSTA
jgi:hypothetical protein